MVNELSERLRLGRSYLETVEPGWQRCLAADIDEALTRLQSAPAMEDVKGVARAIREFVFADTEDAQELPARQYVSNRDDLLARAGIAALPVSGREEGLREALEWYAEKARSLAASDYKTNPEYAAAIFTELALDGGRRAALNSEGGE